ncbi:uncharacterized protein LOC110701555 [Chenopodium quinoa]|uniref:uncharacterized protein LOC110701555 n=1 Tax=Chenopodium quinoa TaxID=63459 RepID=UPI000B794752|nr:uncharacterized protein LOC110701555 [Chenopodium quinoa]
MHIHIICKFYKKWNILVDNVSGLTVKSLCNIRWESRIKSVKAIRFQAPQIKLALQKLYESSGNDAKTKSECESLANCVASYEFLLGIVIWYEILFSIKNVSKKLQTKSMCIGAAMKEVKGIMLYFEEYRNNGFESSINIAKSLAFDMDIEPSLPTKRQIFRKMQFYENNDDLFSELKVLQMTLPNMLMSAHEILEFVKDVDCFPNALIAYLIY